MWILLLHLFLSPIFYFFNLRDRWSCIRLNKKNMHAKCFLRLLTGGTFRHVPPSGYAPVQHVLVSILYRLWRILSLTAAFSVFFIARCVSCFLSSSLSISSSSISSSPRSPQYVSGSSEFSTPSKCSLHLLTSSCAFVLTYGHRSFLTKGSSILCPRRTHSLSSTKC